MTRPITDEELAMLRKVVDAVDWCVRCNRTIDGHLNSGHNSVSIRSILARIDAAEGR